MRSFLNELIQQVEVLSMTEILTQILVAAALGFVIYLSYYMSHTGTIYSRKFNTSLVVLAVLTTVVMTAIGNNVALSLGMVGALSIVRFRTAIKDSRDTVYIFWAIVVGICCGAGDYITASMGSAFVFIVLLLFGRIRNDNRALLILRTARINESKVESLIFNYYNRKAILRAKNTTGDSVEYIYELNGKYLRKPVSEKGMEKSITDAVYEIGGIEYFNIVVQNDEISG